MTNQLLIELSILLSCSMMMPQYVKPGTYSGDKIGLTDLNHRELIPPKLSTIGSFIVNLISRV